MSTSKQTLDLDQAGAGMVLAEDLTDAHGGVLLPAGASLTDANLASLRRRGIEACTVLVEEAAAAEDPAVRAAEQLRLQQRLARLFRASAGLEATPQLLQLLITYRQNG